MKKDTGGDPIWDDEDEGDCEYKFKKIKNRRKRWLRKRNCKSRGWL